MDDLNDRDTVWINNSYSCRNGPGQPRIVLQGGVRIRLDQCLRAFSVTTCTSHCQYTRFAMSEQESRERNEMAMDSLEIVDLLPWNAV